MEMNHTPRNIATSRCAVSFVTVASACKHSPRRPNTELSPWLPNTQSQLKVTSFPITLSLCNSQVQRQNGVGNPAACPLQSKLSTGRTEVELEGLQNENDVD